MQSIFLNSKTYTFCNKYSWSCGCTWTGNLVYTWDMTTSGISCSRMSQPWLKLVYVQVIGYMRTSREFKRIVWICSFFEFPTRSHITYDSWIWLIFRSCLQSAGSYLWYCHIYCICHNSHGITYRHLLILEDIHGILVYTIYDISKYIYLVYDMRIPKVWHSIKDNRAYPCHIYRIYSG